MTTLKELGWLTDYYENKRRLVTSHLSDFFSVKTMKFESAVELKRLIKETFNPLAALDSLDREAHKFEDLVVFLTASRFDPTTRREWERQLGSSGESPTLQQLREFGQSQILTLESIEGGSKSSVSHAKPNKTVASVNVAQSAQKGNTRPSKCSICNQKHYTSACPILHSRQPSERKSLAISKGLCSNCLG